MIATGQACYQDPSGELNLIGWTGNEGSERWGTSEGMGIRALVGTGIGSLGNSKGVSDVFVQVNGSDVSHFVGAGESWDLFETLPLG